ALALQRLGGDLAGGGRSLGKQRRGGEKAGQRHQSHHGPRAGPHRLPPAISALPIVLLVREALLSAECLYHENSHAAPDMIRIPEILTTKCSPAPPEPSARMKCPEHARNTPRQKI